MTARLPQQVLREAITDELDLGVEGRMPHSRIAERILERLFAKGTRPTVQRLLDQRSGAEEASVPAAQPTTSPTDGTDTPGLALATRGSIPGRLERDRAARQATKAGP